MTDFEDDAPGRVGPPPEEAGALLTVDLGALVANWRKLKARAAPAECGAVVKADAYGTGLKQAVEALSAAGCRTFFVAHIGEAIAAREAAPLADIYVLNGLLPGTCGVFGGLNLRPVLGSLEEVAEWRAFCGIAGDSPGAALHVDTAMNRLGLSIEEAHELAREGGSFRPDLLMTHLAAAEDRADDATGRQVSAFAGLRELFPGIPASIANSPGIFHPTVPGLDLVRPGYALYGGNPLPGEPNPMQPVVTLRARIIQLRKIGDGERVGYNGQWTARGPRRIATISTGYADGYPRAASLTDAKLQAGTPAGAAIVAGVRCPFAGRVSMDLITLDVTDVPDHAIRRGDLVTLIGEGLDIDDVGARAGTIGYEVLTGLGARYAREYLEP